ncbi:Insect cuticle protein [Popillia japonica]|uniref:Insect cuticle protein n=1 Tax=Popillia japonica TaxID=7064 RepID=A0AAW1L906_POPJA
MKKLICVALLIAVTHAAPQYNPDGSATILRNELNFLSPSSYIYSYETSNGIAAQEQGHLNNEGRADEALSVRGQYSYVGTDGKTYNVFYVADENGFQPQSAQLSRH